MNPKKAAVLKTLAMLISALVFISLGYLVVKNLDNPNKIYRIGSIIAVALVVILVLVGLIFNSLNGKRTKAKYEERRFKFLDVFYYHKYNNHQEHTEFYYYYVIEDLEDHQIYAISRNQTNSQTEVALDGRVTVFKGQGIKNKWERVNFGDEGSFWIKKELSEFFRKEGKEINFAYGEKLIYYKDQEENPEHKISDLFKKSTYILYNANSENDLKILEKATFISGLLEFDETKK